MMITTIHFPGNCNEAIAYYQEAVGAQVERIDYFRDVPPGTVIEGFSLPNHVMNSNIVIFGTPISMTDGVKTAIISENFTLTVFLDSAEEVTDVFNKLADGGQVIEPLEAQFWVSLTGFVKDRYGVNWNLCTKDALG